MHPSDMFGLLTEAEIMNFIKAAGPDGKGPRYHELTTEEIKDEIEHFVSAAKEQSSQVLMPLKFMRARLSNL